MKLKKVTVGSCTLYRGDCRDVLPRLADRSVDLVLMDPPYGHNNNNGDLIHRREAALGRIPCDADPSLAARPIAGDGPEANELVRFLFAESARVLRCCCCCCCCCGGGGPDPQFARWSLWMDEHLEFKQMVVWDKGPMGMGWHYRRSYETVLVAQQGKGKCHWFDTTKRIENVIRPGAHGIRKIIPSADQHPTEKPVALARHFMRLHTRRRHVVLDPVMGRGWAGLAAIELGRRFIGIELDGEHFEHAVARLRAAWRAKQQTRRQLAKAA